MDLPDRIVPDGLFVNPRGDNTEQVAQLVKSLGLESIRLGFIWVHFEKTMGAPFDFTKHDRLMAEYRQAGIKRFIGLIGSQNEAYHCVWRQKDRDLREGAGGVREVRRGGDGTLSRLRHSLGNHQ